MKRLTLILYLLASGCSSADERFSLAEKDSVKIGMTKVEVEEQIGKPTTTIMSLPGVEVAQWTRGDEENVSSIAVSYGDGKVISVAGSNLK